MSLCRALIDIESSIRTRIGYPPLAGATKGNSMSKRIYERSELQQYFKVGERAIVRKTYFQPHSDYVGQVGVIDEFDQDPDPWLTMGDGKRACATQLEKVGSALETLEVGDVVEVTKLATGGYSLSSLSVSISGVTSAEMLGTKRTVLGVLGNGIYILSTHSDQDCSGGIYTVKDLERNGYTAKGAETEETLLTVKEIEDKLKITNLRIKKESN